MIENNTEAKTKVINIKINNNSYDVNATLFYTLQKDTNTHLGFKYINAPSKYKQGEPILGCINLINPPLSLIKIIKNKHSKAVLTLSQNKEIVIKNCSFWDNLFTIGNNKPGLYSYGFRAKQVYYNKIGLSNE